MTDVFSVLEKAAKVIAIGKQGGKITGYDKKGKPIYDKEAATKPRNPNLMETKPSEDLEPFQKLAGLKEWLVRRKSRGHVKSPEANKLVNDTLNWLVTAHTNPESTFKNPKPKLPVTQADVDRVKSQIDRIRKLDKEHEAVKGPARKEKPAAKPEPEPEKESYMMQHRPSKTSPVYDLAQDGAIPDDIYTHPQYYADMSQKTYKESFAAIQKMRGNPDAEVTIYRAAPVGEIRTGDWVTLSKTYAELESKTEGTPVHAFKVKAKDVWFAGDDINEFGYWGDKKSKSDIKKGDVMENETCVFDDLEKAASARQKKLSRIGAKTGGGKGGGGGGKPGGVIAIGKRGGKIIGYDRKMKPIYEGTPAAREFLAQQESAASDKKEVEEAKARVAKHSEVKESLANWTATVMGNEHIPSGLKAPLVEHVNRIRELISNKQPVPYSLIAEGEKISRDIYDRAAAGKDTSPEVEADNKVNIEVAGGYVRHSPADGTFTAYAESDQPGGKYLGDFKTQAEAEGALKGHAMRKESAKRASAVEVPGGQVIRSDPSGEAHEAYVYDPSDDTGRRFMGVFETKSGAERAIEYEAEKVAVATGQKPAPISEKDSDILRSLSGTKTDELTFDKLDVVDSTIATVFDKISPRANAADLKAAVMLGEKLTGDLKEHLATLNAKPEVKAYYAEIDRLTGTFRHGMFTEPVEPEAVRLTRKINVMLPVADSLEGRAKRFLERKQSSNTPDIVSTKYSRPAGALPVGTKVVLSDGPDSHRIATVTGQKSTEWGPMATIERDDGVTDSIKGKPTQLGIGWKEATPEDIEMYSRDAKAGPDDDTYITRTDGKAAGTVVNPDGTYDAMTPTDSKSFKTKKGAENWLKKRGFAFNGEKLGDKGGESGAGGGLSAKKETYFSNFKKLGDYKTGGAKGRVDYNPMPISKARGIIQRLGALSTVRGNKQEVLAELTAMKKEYQKATRNARQRQYSYETPRGSEADSDAYYNVMAIRDYLSQMVKMVKDNDSILSAWASQLEAKQVKKSAIDELNDFITKGSDMYKAEDIVGPGVAGDGMEKSTPIGGTTPGGYKKIAEGKYVKEGMQGTKSGKVEEKRSLYADRKTLDQAKQAALTAAKKDNKPAYVAQYKEGTKYAGDFAIWDHDQISAWKKRGRMPEFANLVSTVYPDGTHKDHASIKKSAVDELNEFITDGDQDMNKSDMPSGEAKLGYTKGEKSPDGGSLESTPKTGGKGNAVEAKIGAPGVPVKKLSEDDETDEAQMKPHKKPIEKSIDSSERPYNRNTWRDDLAYETAKKERELHKSDDIEVGPGVASQQEEKKLIKANTWQQGFVSYSDGSDQAASELVKADGFYHGGSPTIGRPNSLLLKSTVCKACGTKHGAMYKTCPECGEGAKQEKLTKSYVEAERPPVFHPGLRPAKNDDLYLPDGITLTDDE